MQHNLINNYVSNINGKIVFYNSEDDLTLSNLKIYLNHLRKKPNINGFIFLMLEQLCFGNEFSINVISETVKYNYEIHFIKQNIFLSNMNEFNEQLQNLLVFWDCYQIDNDITIPHL